jgi:hypothetical protein
LEFLRKGVEDSYETSEFLLEKKDYIHAAFNIEQDAPQKGQKFGEARISNTERSMKGKDNIFLTPRFILERKP